MIRIIRNTKTNRVVALQVNGKQFSVSKDLGHALSLEEDSNVEQTKELLEKAKTTQKKINSKSYYGESSMMKLRVEFDEMNRIDSSKTAIEFKKGIDSCSKEAFLSLIEDFILSVNRAQYKRHLAYCSTFNSLAKNKKSA